MIFAYLTLIFILLGIFFWVIGAFIDKRARRFNKAGRINYRKIARYFGIVAKISLILSAVSFVIAFIWLQGMQG